ncbi:MAG: YjgP/YjgQ family permease [Proteobacteria bacterium]|nr:YjgP/YjgQ family permease [Pseudomonadota bacterium]
MRILDRYVVSEMAGPFLFGVCTFTLLFMSVDTFMRAARMFSDGTQGLKVAAVFVLASIPGVLAYAFPMSSLLACLMAFGRLSADSEVVAMKAGGISLYRIARPGLALTVVLSIVAFYLIDQIAPEANYQAHNLVAKQLVAESGQMQNLKVQEVAADGTDRVVLARSFDLDRGLLSQLTILFYRSNLRVRVMYAEDAVWEKQSDGLYGWVMHKVKTQDLDANQSVTYDTFSEQMVAPIASTPAQLAVRPRGRDEMTRDMLLDKIRYERYMAQIEAEEARVAESKGLKKGENKGLKKAWSYTVEYYSRIAIPFSCLVFGLFGIPLGLQPHRTSKSIGLGLSIIFIFIYYLLMTTSRSLGESGILPPFVAAWLPNALFAAVGMVLLVRAGKV